MTFSEFMRERFGPGWAIARKTPKNLARYARCITRKEFYAARDEWEQLS